MKDLEKEVSPARTALPEDVKDSVDKRDDAVAVFLAEVAVEEPELLKPWSTSEEKRLLRRKIDPIVMTLSQFCLMMGAVDKVCIGTAATLGMRSDLGLSGSQYSWISSIIYFGAIVAVLPSLFLMQRVNTAKYIAFNCSVWGIILMASAGAKSFGGLLAARFILGLFESIIFAGFGTIISAWWTKDEQPWRTAVIFSTLSSVVNGLLSYAASRYHGSLGQWQVLFLSVGAITFAWAILCCFFLAGSPLEAHWLSRREKVIAIQRVAGNMTGVQNKVVKPKQIVEAFIDPKSWLIFAINLCLNVPNNGVLTFNSIIVSALGFSTSEVQLLALPTGVVSWCSSIIFGYIAVKTKQRCATAIAAALVPFASTIVLYLVPRSNVGGSLAGLYLLFCYWGPYIVVQTLMYANNAGYTKKVTVYAISYIGYCVGNLIGPQTFKASQAPRYASGVAAMLSCYAVAMFLIVVYWLYILYLNKKKARQLSEYEANHPKEENFLEEWHDQTDWDNPKFVYTY